MSVRKRTWKTSTGAEREKWVADYKDGQGVRRLKTFERKKDADAWVADTKVEIKEGRHVPDSATVTVGKAADDWLASCVDLERTTRDQYQQHTDLHIKPFLSSLKLAQLNVPTVRSFHDKLREEGRSPAMVKRITVSLGCIIADAQERGLAAHNPVREMAKRRPRGKTRQGERRRKKKLRVGVDIPTPDEIRAILDHAKGRWRPLLVTAVFSGLRASELRGLRWSDVNLKEGRIHVRQRADRYNDIGMPKSDAGQRTIPIGPFVVNTLREWKLRCPESELGLVFPTGNGKIEYHANIRKRGLIPPQIVAGVTAQEIDEGGNPMVDEDGQPIVTAKYTGLHALRHFYASWCINRPEDGGLGLPPKMVQERLGHSSITMTMDVYGHLFPSTDDGKALAEAERQLMAVPSAT